MNYEFFRELFKDSKRRLKYRAIACLFCIPIWIFGTDIPVNFEVGLKVHPSWFTRGDAIGTAILLILAVIFSDGYK